MWLFTCQRPNWMFRPRECRRIAPVIPAKGGIHRFPYVKHAAALGHSGFRLSPE